MVAAVSSRGGSATILPTMPAIDTLTLSLALSLTAAAALVGVAQADPCDAPLPRRGESFSGPVTRVIDGDSICVGDDLGGIEVRVADYSAPELREPGGAEARRMMESLAFQREVTCLAGRRSYDRTVAICRLASGLALGEAMRRAGAPEGGR
jgi:endonuclease YncB( thermonuclease family)